MATEPQPATDREANRIRAFLTRRYVQPARSKGLGEITIVAGKVHTDIGLLNHMPQVCSVLAGEAFLSGNALELIERSGPRQGAAAAFRYRLLDGASPPRSGAHLPARRAAPAAAKPRPEGAKPLRTAPHANGSLLPNEQTICNAIRARETALRKFLESHHLSQNVDPAGWLRHLAGIRQTIGNINYGLTFVAMLLVKQYFERRFGDINFDAGATPPGAGAAAARVQARTPDGETIIGEIKTVAPSQLSSVGTQRDAMVKDLARLAAAARADYRFLFVTDGESYKTLRGEVFSSAAPGVELVDLVSGDSCMLGRS